MDAEAIGQQIQETLLGIFRRGSRYQTEKVATLFGYILLSVLSVGWALSGSGADNRLGADFGKGQIEEISTGVYFLNNQSKDDWTNVRVVLNQRYLHKRDKLEAKGKATLGGKDFDYFYYIPRTWGQRDWEQLTTQAKPNAKAPTDLEPTYVQIRADQGLLDLDLTKPRTPDAPR